MSQHSDLESFLRIANNLVDSLIEICSSMKCKIRVEQEIARNASKDYQKDSAAAQKAPAFVSSERRQDGPGLPAYASAKIEGTPKASEEFVLNDEVFE